MSLDKPTIVELAKYPIIVLSIFLALVGAKYLLGIPLESLTEITAQGVKFNANAKGEISNLSAQLNGALQSIEELKTALKAPLSAEAESAIFEASQTVTAQMAELTNVNNLSRGSESSGFIWIGDYNTTNSTWGRVKLLSVLTNRVIELKPNEIVSGMDFILSGNMVLREGLPKDDDRYYKDQRSLGVLPSGSRVKVVSTPVGIQRNSVNQYWMEVTALK